LIDCRQKKIAKSTRFEDALGELESIVQSLESGEQSLEVSLEQFERGISLSRFCQQSLSEAEKAVEVLLEKQGEESLEVLEKPDA